MHNQPLLPGTFSTAVRLQNCRKAQRYVGVPIENPYGIQ